MKHVRPIGSASQLHHITILLIMHKYKTNFAPIKYDHKFITFGNANF